MPPRRLAAGAVITAPAAATPCPSASPGVLEAPPARSAARSPTAAGRRSARRARRNPCDSTATSRLPPTAATRTAGRAPWRRSERGSSCAEICPLYLRIVAQAARIRGERHAARFEHVAALGRLERV